jgi:ADP-ribose pyrophosphatase YjhB (NUDIX family)
MGSFKYPMKFCSTCSAPVTVKVPLGDNRPRAVCDACGAIHYDNPKVVVGCLVVAGSSVLLCRRGIDPRSGFWTLPAGYLEKGETTEQGAVRETWEEARARVDIDSLYTIFDLPYISQIYMFYRARLRDGRFSAGEETAEARVFVERDIPWGELAFPVVDRTLEHYFRDRRNDEFPIRSESIKKRPIRRQP